MTEDLSAKVQIVESVYQDKRVESVRVQEEDQIYHVEVEAFRPVYPHELDLDFPSHFVASGMPEFSGRVQEFEFSVVFFVLLDEHNIGQEDDTVYMPR
jgi:hypothetical protein